MTDRTLDDTCPICLGEGIVFPDDVLDWLPCKDCHGTGDREDGDG